MNNTNPSSTPQFSGKPTPPPYIEDGGSSTPPPFNEGVTPQLFEEPAATQRHRPIEPLKKNVVNKVVVIVAVILVVGLLLIGYYAVKKTAVAPVTKRPRKWRMLHKPTPTPTSLTKKSQEKKPKP